MLGFAETTHDAEDIVATTFLELWRLRDRVRVVDGSLLPWLLVTALNVGRNAGRGQRRYRRFLATVVPSDDRVDAGELALDRIDALRGERRTIAALRGLPFSDAEILVLVGLEGFTIAEAAIVLDITVAAAKKRLSRARSRAREHLQDLDTPDLSLIGRIGRTTP